VKAELARDKADPSDAGGRGLLGEGRQGAGQDSDQGKGGKAEGEAAHRKPQKSGSGLEGVVPGDNGPIAAPLWRPFRD
jgi:hypothetical protein